MKIALVYDSSTGTTAKAAQAMGAILEKQGHQCTVQSHSNADPAEVATADLIAIGSWVKGYFIIKQHPTLGTLDFINRLGNLAGKKAVVFCTYKVATGSTLPRMARALESQGAQVVGRFKYRGPEPNRQFETFAASLT